MTVEEGRGSRRNSENSDTPQKPCLPGHGRTGEGPQTSVTSERSLGGGSKETEDWVTGTGPGAHPHTREVLRLTKYSHSTGGGPTLRPGRLDPQGSEGKVFGNPERVGHGQETWGNPGT